MPSMDRRTFLHGLTAAGASSMVPRLGFASGDCTEASRNLIVVFVKGGWDSTFSLDAKEPSDFIDPPTGTIATAGNIDYFNATGSQNAVKNFFDAHYDVTAIVKGIQVSSISHSGCTNKVLTGTGSPFADTEFLDMELQDEAAVRDFLTARAQRFQATRGQTGYNQRRVDDFIASVQRRYDLNDFALPQRPPGASLNFPLSDQLDLAKTAITDGLSHAVVASSNEGYDTHDNNDNQGARQKSLFEDLNVLITDLKDTQLIDHTTVVVLSEMTRTPKTNGEAGKDHWPVACAMVIGAGVAGNQVYGHTSERMEGVAVNYQDGSLTGNDLQFVKTENFVAGLLDLMNVPIPEHLTGTPFAPFKAS